MSTTYDKWKTTTRSAASLFLDSENPRLAPGTNYNGERQLIIELVRHEKVLELAESISTNGFFPSEHVIVVKEGSKNIVVEGNRRVAACKVLIVPSLAPKEYEKKAKMLAANFDLAALGRIPVCIAPSREAAIPLIIARHTSPQIEKWEPAMQGNFYASLLEKGLSIEKIAAQFGVKATDVRSTLHAHNLYKMACRLTLPDNEAQKVRDPRKFSLSTLARVFENQEGRRFFGVDLESGGGVKGKIAPGEFEKGFKRFVRDVAEGKEDSRTLHDTGKIRLYLQSFNADDVPNHSIPGSFDSGTFLPAKSSTQYPVIPSTRSIKKLAPTSHYGLLPSSVTCGIQNTRLRNLLAELQKLSPAKYPNAASLTFRTFIEISLFCFLSSKGELTNIRHSEIVRLKKKNPSNVSLPPQWAPGLKLMLEWISDPQRALLQNPHALKALPKVMKDNEELFAFNLAAHNSAWHPTEAKLREIWSNLEEVFKEILQ